VLTYSQASSLNKLSSPSTKHPSSYLEAVHDEFSSDALIVVGKLDEFLIVVMIESKE
jgi:hypothetical protein